MREYRFALRVYYEDTDLSGLVYHASYLKFFERGRTEMLRALGVHHHELAEQGLAFAVRRMSIEFVAPARIDDELIVVTQVRAATGVRLDLIQSVLREELELCAATVEVASIRIGGGATRLPHRLRERMSTPS